MRASSIHLLIVVILTLTTATHPALGERKYEVEVQTFLKPVKAVGILIDEKGSETFQATLKQAKLNKNIYIISFVGPDLSQNFSATVSGFIVDEEGEVAYSNVHSAHPEMSTVSHYDLPLCQEFKQDPHTHNSISTLGLVSALLEVRGKRRTLLKRKVKQLLTKDLRAHIERLEAGFGLAYAEPISPDLEFHTLFFRLVRLNKALEMYRRNENNRAYYNSLYAKAESE